MATNKYLDYAGLSELITNLKNGKPKVGKAVHADSADLATKANGVNWGSAGVIPLANIPQGALERVVVVADDTARFKLTTGQAQLGDTIKVTSTGRMYIVVDESKMNSADGYMEYSAGKAATADSATEAQHAAKADSATEANHAASASSVPWSGVTGKPSTYAPSAHNHPSSQVTNVDALPTQNGNRAATGKSLNQNLSNLNKGLDDLSSGKADKATTLAEYGITDAYTKAEADVLLDVSGGMEVFSGFVDGKTPKNGVMYEPTKKYFVYYDNGTPVGDARGWDGCNKFNTPSDSDPNNLIHRPPTPLYNKIFINSEDSVAYYWNGSDLVKVGNGRKTLADYGITDAYTKSEADAKHSALQTNIDTKATKATTLNGYGIGDAYTKTEIDSKLSGVQASMVAITNAEIDSICNS